MNMITSLILSICLVAVPAMADHLGWMARYRTRFGDSCCHDRDCVPADVEVLSEAQGHVVVNGEPLEVDPRILFRMPPEAGLQAVSGLWCFGSWGPKLLTAANTLCLFYRSGNG